MIPSVTKWPAAAALAAVGCVSVARVDTPSVLAFCLRRMHKNTQSKNASLSGGVCLCRFILQKTNALNQAGTLQARVFRPTLSDTKVHLIVMCRFALALLWPMIEVIRACLRRETFLNTPVAL